MQGLPTLHIGCCGWSYLREQEFTQSYRQQPASKLQAYAQLFDTVEINSTFYRIPRLTTAQKWRREASAVNPHFEFTVKVYQGITHLHRFGKASRSQFNRVKTVAKVLQTNLVLFQSPASFKPSSQNIKKLNTFFSSVERDGLIFVWEPRGQWYEDEGVIAEVCEDNDLIHCVDPFRNEPLAFGREKIAYFRVHGFGKPSMYNYDFSPLELKSLGAMIDSLPKSLGAIYVLFNNANCYHNGLDFAGMVT